MADVWSRLDRALNSPATVTHRLQYWRVGESAGARVGTGCGTPDEVLFFSEEPTCAACRAAPVMATAGACNVDANGAEVAQPPRALLAAEEVSWLIA